MSHLRRFAVGRPATSLGSNRPLERQRRLRVEQLEARLVLAADLAQLVSAPLAAPITTSPPSTEPTLPSKPETSREVTKTIVPGHVIVAFDGDRALAEMTAVLRNSLALARLDIGGSVDVERLFSVGEDPANKLTLATLRLGEAQDVLAAGKVIEQLPGVAWTQPDFAYRGDIKEFVPNDPLYGVQYHHSLLQNPTAWNTTLGDNLIVVAVTDDGLQLNHPDLMANLYSRPGEIPNNLIDDDGNGFVDDVNGWDFVSNDNNPSPFVATDNHGTHVAGIIAAVADNALGVAGIAPNVRIMPIRFFGADGGFTSLIVAQSFVYAADQGVEIVNTSYNIDSFVGDGLFTFALQYLYDRNVLHINGAGNNNELNPARQAFHQTLLVASTGPADVRSTTSNYGTGIDISAPGENVMSTVTGGGYAEDSGTSVSAPMAAGVAALIWSQDRFQTRDQVASRLTGTATNINAQNPAYIGLLGNGRVNSNDGLNATLAAPRINRLIEVPTTINPSIFPISRLTVSLANVFSKPTIEAAANWRLASAGSDGVLGTADDVPVPLTRSAPYMVGANEVVFTFPTLATGLYRFTGVSGGLRDPWGNVLDGDSNGSAGGNFIKDFRIITGTPVFSADFSDAVGAPSADGFTTAGPVNMWHLSTGRGADPGHSADDSVYFGAGETATGGGQYIDDALGAVFSPVINLTTFTAPVSLHFNHFLQSETGFDFAIVSVIDGATTTDIAISGTTLPHNTTGWESVDLDLSAYAGRNIQIQFTFASDFSITDEGWYVDDVEVFATSGGTLGTLAGVVFNDIDGDGTIDTGDNGLGGWTTYLDINNNGQLDNNLPVNVTSTDTPITIYDSTVIHSFLTVSGIAGVISDVNVTLNINHSFDEDLDVFLITPNGGRVELFTDVGGNFDNFTGTILDDEAANSITAGSAPFTGSFRPEGQLSVLDGLNPNGVWRLQITDDHAPDLGSLRDWSLNFTISEPTSITDATGSYQFPNLLPGTYTVRQVLLPNYQSTTPPGDSYTLTVNAGQFLAGLNFGNQVIPTEIRGTVWNDVNGNRIRDVGDNGQAGWTVYLDANNNGTFDSQTSNLISTDVPKTIFDFTTVTSNTIVAGLGGVILDANVVINLTHTFDGDLDIFLVSPTGVRVELSTDNGNGGVNFSMTGFDDEVPTSITTGVAPFIGSYRPETPLSALDGLLPNGTWRLEITDDAGGDIGVLTAWSLQLSVAESSSITSATGEYVFSGLSPGTYIVREVVQPTWKQVLPVSGFNSSVVLASQTTVGQDFANTQGNSAPLISNVPDQTIPEDGSALVNFTINDLETPVANLTLSATSSNPTLLPLSNIVFGGALGNRSVQFTPAANQFGTSTVNIIVTDTNGAIVQDTVVVTVSPINDAPTFVRGTNQFIAISAGAQSIPNWATLIAPGPANEIGQAINFVVTNNTNPSLFASPPVVDASGTLTYMVAPGLAGTATITLVLRDNGGTANGGADTSVPQSFFITASPPTTLQVTNVSRTSTGFIVDFNNDLNPSSLNLYDVQGSGLGPADILLVGASTGTVRGSALVDASLRRVTFIRTEGLLAPDNYTVTLRSGADGFVGTTMGQLDGDANGVAGSDFVQTFSVPPYQFGVPLAAISVPNFARGPGQSVNVPANVTSGIPVTLTDGSGLNNVRFDLRYDPALLTISAVQIAPSAPPGGVLFTDSPSPGVLSIIYTGTLTSGPIHLLNISASVPATAPYNAKQVLEIRNVSGQGGTIPMDGDSAVHSVAYLGDVTGNGTYSSQDASRISRVAVGLDSGLAQFKLLDPVVIADISGNGLISSTDTSRLMQAAVAISVPEIPPLPIPAVSLLFGGPDPKLSLPTDLVASPGAYLLVPVNIDSIVDLTGTGVESADLVLYYDPAVLEVSSVTLGSLLPPEGGWIINSRIDPLAGRIFVSLAGQQPLEGYFAGELVKLHSTVKANTPAGASAINLAAGSYSPSRQTQVNEGYLTLIPAPTDAANDPIDGRVTIIAPPGTVSQATARLVDGQLRITGTHADDRLIIGQLDADRVRVRAGSSILGDFPLPSGIAIDSGGGNDYVVVDLPLPTALAATGGDVIFASSQTAILNRPASDSLALNPASLSSAEFDEALLQILASWSDESPTPSTAAGQRLVRFGRR